MRTSYYMPMDCKEYIDTSLSDLRKQAMEYMMATGNRRITIFKSRRDRSEVGTVAYNPECMNRFTWRYSIGLHQEYPLRPDGNIRRSAL